MAPLPAEGITSRHGSKGARDTNTAAGRNNSISGAIVSTAGLGVEWITVKEYFKEANDTGVRTRFVEYAGPYQRPLIRPSRAILATAVSVRFLSELAPHSMRQSHAQINPPLPLPIDHGHSLYGAARFTI